MSEPLTVSVIVITMGDRADAVAELVESLQAPARCEWVLFGNGAIVQPPSGWLGGHSPENLGVSGGRRAAAKIATGDLLVFLDDDCVVRTNGLVEKIAEVFVQHAGVGAVALRIAIAGTNDTPSHWNPRLGRSRVSRAGWVTSFLGGGHAIRRTAYEQVGGYHPDFFYSHEETDLAWRLLDAGWQIRYEPGLLIEHPATEPDRNPSHLWHASRNHIWLARQRLPAPVGVIYVAVWAVIQLGRVRRWQELKAVVNGGFAGFVSSPGTRDPIRWSTIWRMSRLGRPPLV